MCVMCVCDVCVCVCVCVSPHLNGSFDNGQTRNSSIFSSKLCCGSDDSLVCGTEDSLEQHLCTSGCVKVRLSKFTTEFSLSEIKKITIIYF